MNIPENGFYYHYKHDPTKDLSNYAYEVTGIGKHTEDGNDFVIYRPLYEVSDIAPATFFVRPIELFFDEVEYQGKTLPHFLKIINSELISKLTMVRDQMYIS